MDHRRAEATDLETQPVSGVRDLYRPGDKRRTNKPIQTMSTIFIWPYRNTPPAPEDTGKRASGRSGDMFKDKEWKESKRLSYWGPTGPGCNGVAEKMSAYLMTGVKRL
ncbi:hypothetical protein EYF80_000804 [Liparis tanakae]|uniref:Uncharacterized protein n=1 Tax=Liparis tanakae TaxID=230148 RepID=A0A4Z2JF96_9TELE|nr:hypothetical protein EYF80_000804 [Liparis tanakae]